ncbi:MAG: hypothetical protein E7563_05210, partial [Ruminococcaceae bacterium]|nr:hypothetical protein [Oscillospiraceae bacterium]
MQQALLKEVPVFLVLSVQFGELGFFLLFYFILPSVLITLCFNVYSLSCFSNLCKTLVDLQVLIVYNIFCCKNTAIKHAGVAELADAPDLGSGGTPVQ